MKKDKSEEHLKYLADRKRDEVAVQNVLVLIFLGVVIWLVTSCAG